MIKKALHIIMATMVLVSTMGITINMHFCHDQLIDLALYSPAESCCDVNHKAPCDSQEGLAPTDHCDDNSIIVKAVEDFVGSSFTFNFANHESTDILFWIALQFSSPALNEDVKTILPDYYLPPPYQEVDLSQIQSFLI